MGAGLVVGLFLGFPAARNKATVATIRSEVAEVPDDVPLTYTTAVGERLRALRRQRGLSLQAVEEASAREFKASVLGAYERGERIISILRLQKLAQFYRVPVDQILPAPSGPAGAEGQGAEEFVPKRPLVIDLVRLNETEAIEGQIVRRYVNSILNARAGVHGSTVTIRAEDLRALGRFLERDEISMEKRLVELGLRY